MNRQYFQNKNGESVKVSKNIKIAIKKIIKKCLVGKLFYKIFLLKIIVVTGLIAGLVLSSRLWFGERSFPQVPVFGDLPNLSLFIEGGLFIFLVGVLLVIAASSRPQKLIFSCLVVVGVFVVFDQMRLQAWLYQYFFILAALGLFSWKPSDVKGQNVVFNTLRLIVASTYFFSGLQKINFGFVDNVFPWVVESVAIFSQTHYILHCSCLGRLFLLLRRELE